LTLISPSFSQKYTKIGYSLPNPEQAMTWKFVDHDTSNTESNKDNWKISESCNSLFAKFHKYGFPSSEPDKMKLPSGLMIDLTGYLEDFEPKNRDNTFKKMNFLQGI